MKKKLIIWGVIVVLIALPSIWLGTRPEALGSMNHVCTKPTTGFSDFLFNGEDGDTLKINFSSHVAEGTLDIILYDPYGNKVYKLDQAKELVTFFTLDTSGTYMLVGEYSDFVGRFKVTVSKVE